MDSKYCKIDEVSMTIAAPIEQLELFGSNVLSITLYDVSGAPIHPGIVGQLIAKAESLAKTDNCLALDIRSQ